MIMTNPDQKSASKVDVQSDEVDLWSLFILIWKGKWIVLGVTVFVTSIFIATALYLPNEYRAVAIVQPNDDGNGSNLNALSGQLGGLASLAGISLGAADSSDAVIAMEIIKSWNFAEEFIKRHDLSVPLFAANDWSRADRNLSYDSDIYDPVKKKWVRNPPAGKTIEPTSWELYEQYRKRVKISQNVDTGLINISVIFYSPFVAKQWTDWLVQDINQFMKERALKEANRSIQYLEEQINQTSVAEIRTIFSELIQEQHKVKMLAQVSDEFIFKTISKAKAPEKRVKPRQAFLTILGFVLGLVLGCVIVFILNIIKMRK